MNKFKNYLSQIKNQEIKKQTELAIKKLPKYFWEVAASSTGKYHPKFSLGKGGLVRHTQLALDFAIELFRIYEIKDFNKDIIIASIILHDGLKQGANSNGHSIKNHDDVTADWLNNLWKEFKGKKAIVNCVRSHMGNWHTTKAPETKIEKFVHLCDYLASRKIYDKYYE